MVSLNVPTSGPTSIGPQAAYELIPVSDVTTVNGGVNLLQSSSGDYSSVLIDLTMCYADMLVQFFLQDSPTGIPFIRFARAGTKQIYRFGSAVDFLVFSNLSGSFPLPLGFGNIVVPRQPRNTGGYIVLSGIDQDLEIDNLEPEQSEILMDSGTLAPSAFFLQKVENIPPGTESLLLVLREPANCSSVIVQGFGTLATYLSLSTGISALTAIPVGPGSDGAVLFTLAANSSGPLDWYLVARKDSVLNTASQGVPVGSPMTPLVNGTNIGVSSSGVVTVPVTPTTTCLWVAFSNPQNVAGFYAHGHQSGIMFRGLAASFPAPAPVVDTTLQVVPVMSPFDTTVDVGIQTNSGGNTLVWIVARSDSFNVAVDQFDNRDLVTIPKHRPTPATNAQNGGTRTTAGTQNLLTNTQPKPADRWTRIIVQLAMAIGYGGAAFPQQGGGIITCQLFTTSNTLTIASHQTPAAIGITGDESFNSSQWVIDDLATDWMGTDTTWGAQFSVSGPGGAMYFTAAAQIVALWQ